MFQYLPWVVPPLLGWFTTCMTTWGWGRIGKSPTAEMVDVVWPVLVAVCEKRVNKENYVDLK